MPDDPILDDPTRIEASPTKEFFIFMLTRDIDLTRSIADLVDNCVDGARRLRPNQQYAGLWVRIEANGDRFKISDNCGGISVEVARKYAFRFGRASEMPETPHSIGQFGVGMKRALFKIGHVFRVESRNSTARFVVKEDLREWVKDKTKWDFYFTELDEDLPEAQETAGTTIEVSELLSGIADEFRLENFETRLRNILSAAHQSSMERGLAITLNGVPLSFSPADLLRSDELMPAYRAITSRHDDIEIQVKLYVGLGKSEPSDAGWSVFCNGRLILEADKSRKTGWGDSNPNYHNEYARFRGFAFFDSDKAVVLPWNTTKSDVDEDSPVYRAIRLQMIQMMRPVIDFLIKVAAEKKRHDSDDPTALETKIAATRPTSLGQLAPQEVFLAPTVVAPPPPVRTITRVCFNAQKADVDEVKRTLGVSTNYEVGEEVFAYYLRMECE
jgi:hypothetical protein